MYKFLARGAVGPFSRFRWPTPGPTDAGDWIAVDGELELASNGIHACRVDQLPYWLGVELWEVEVRGETIEADRHVVARMGRLVRRIRGWNGTTATELAEACVERSRRHAVELLRLHGEEHAADRIATSEGSAGLMTTAWEAGSGVPDVLAEPILDAGDTGFAVHANLGTCLAAYLAARSARSAAAAGGRSPGEAVAAERGWQADWLRTTLQLKG